MKTLVIPTFVVTLLSVVHHSQGAETRYHEFTRQFGEPVDGVKVVSAGFFGSSGHEWLSAGGFAPDGTILLAGNVVGPDFRPSTVLGQDGSAPVAAERQHQRDGKGKEMTQKDGSPRWKMPSWQDPGVTGFILRVSADLKTVISAQRMPWESGAITACVVGGDGAVYLAGKATTSITCLGGDVKEMPAFDSGLKSGACDHTFVAKLASDLSRVEWVRHLKGASNAPKLEILKDGSLQFTAQDLRCISPAGEVLGKVVVPGGPGHLAAVNPKDGSVVRGGEHHSPTGREPWRCPVLNIYNPDGSQRHQLYDWLGPYVGLDNLRLESDTAVRRVDIDRDGNLVVVLWSDGGNSVGLREAFDVRRFAKGFHGLGFSNWGAGVLSCAYLLRIDPVTLRVRQGTMWLSYLEAANKPNSAWIDQLGFAPDGSACFTGRSANSLIQTGNRLSPSQNGQYVAILRDDFSSIRFSSTVPGAGMAVTGNGDETWGIAFGNAGSKQRVLFLSGAGEGEGEFKTPVVNAGQATFGGGWMDGYAVLLEMDRNPASDNAKLTDEQITDWQPVTGAVDTGKAPTFVDSKGRGPAVGQTFFFDARKWVTVDAEFRDPADRLWPSFFYGNPAGGSFKLDPARPEMQCSLTCDRVCQPNGTPSSRVMGDWMPEAGKPLEFSFEIKSISPFRTRSEVRQNGKREEKREVNIAVADCIMKAAGRSVPVKTECRFLYQYAKDSKVPEGVQMDATFTTTGKTLGLKNPKAAGEIRVRVSGVAVSR